MKIPTLKFEEPFFALDSAGRSIPARIAMMAMTTSSSMRVKPDELKDFSWNLFDW